MDIFIFGIRVKTNAEGGFSKRISLGYCVLSWAHNWKEIVGPLSYNFKMYSLTLQCRKRILSYSVDKPGRRTNKRDNLSHRLSTPT